MNARFESKPLKIAAKVRTKSDGKEGFVTKHKSAEVVAGKDTRIDVDLDRGREIRGRVVDKSGQAVANAEVVIRKNFRASP